MVLRDRFGYVPKPNDNVTEQIMGVYSEDSIHASIIFSQFPKSQTRQALRARAYTTAPQSWSVYLSQRKRWALGSKSNELMMIFRPGILLIERICSLITIITWWIGPFVVSAIITLIIVFIRMGIDVFNSKLMVGLLSVLLFRYVSVTLAPPRSRRAAADIDLLRSSHSSSSSGSRTTPWLACALLSASSSTWWPLRS